MFLEESGSEGLMTAEEEEGKACTTKIKSCDQCVTLQYIPGCSPKLMIATILDDRFR